MTFPFFFVCVNGYCLTWEEKAKRLRPREGKGWGKARWPHPSAVTSPSGKYSERKKKRSVTEAARPPLWRQPSNTTGAAHSADTWLNPIRSTAFQSGGLWIFTTWLSLPLLRKRQSRFKAVAMPKITDNRSRRNSRWLPEPSVLSTTARTPTFMWLTILLHFLIFFDNK